MSKLEDLRAKLQAYKSLPSSDCRAIGEHLLPLVIDIIEEEKTIAQRIKKEHEEAFMNMVKRNAENETVTYINIVGVEYCFYSKKIQP